MPQSPLRGDRPGTPYGAQAPEEHGGSRKDARSLIEQGEAQYPPELRAAMQRHRDEEATEALDLRALSREYGVNVIGAAVYGLADQRQTLVYLYESESGRTARWYAPYEQAVAEPPPSEEPEPETPDPTAVEEPEPEPEPEPEGGPPYPEYDRQSVAEIVNDDRITAENAEQVRAYEREHRNRKGVLSHLDSLGG